MKSHLRRWGAIYILFALFLASWGLSLHSTYYVEASTARTHGEALRWSDVWWSWWDKTTENWQSEFLSNTVTGILLTGAVLGRLLYNGDRSPESTDTERLEAKIDDIRDALGLDDKRERSDR